MTTTMHTGTAEDVVLSLDGITKAFGAQLALDSVSLEVKAGEVHALVGQNGCGKSTLVKLLSGVYTPDGGVAAVSGQPFQLGSMSAANDAGLRFVHQDLGLIPALTVAENFYMSSHRGWVNKISVSDERKRTSRALQDFGYDIDPRALVASLSAAQRTAVAIVRALDGDTAPPLLVLDEPTASLPGPDAELLFDALRRLTQAGNSVLFISHHLDEVLGLADSVTVLRDGRHIATSQVSSLTYDRLVEQMLGRELKPRSQNAKVAAEKAAGDRDPRLVVRGLHGAGLQGVDLEVYPGEVLGIAGLTGSGRESIAGAISGQTSQEGTVQIDGKAIRSGDPADSLRHGLAYAPAERRRDALLTAATLRENLTIADISSISKRGRVSRRAERAAAQKWMTTLDVRPPDQERMIVQFSGGNQQKVVLGRLLRTNPGVLVLDEPTQGVDVGAKATIHDLVVRAAADGAAVIVCSSDVEELIQVSTRVVVLRRGRVGAELTGADLTVEGIEEEQLQPSEVGPSTHTADDADEKSENAHA